MAKLNPVRVPIPRLDPETRRRVFQEIEPGYSPEEAAQEAARCIFCPKPQCVQGCPARNDIPGFIEALLEKDIEKAAQVLKRTSSFPGICSRVCDHARQCEGHCVIAKRGDPVAIGALERYVADHSAPGGLNSPALAQAMPGRRSKATRVAIVGAGPAGLAAAKDLAGLGHQVTVLEKLPLCSGVLAWGIPAFRLPWEVIQAELETVESMGAELKVETALGPNLTIDDLFGQGFQAVFVAAGVTRPIALGVPGEHLDYVYNSTEFLTQAKLANLFPGQRWSAPFVGSRAAIVGGGNTAMDCAQTALRLGAEEVTVVYRRSEAEIPARREEIHTGQEEGVHFQYLVAPVAFRDAGDGRVSAMECQRMELGEPDASGRRRPIPLPDSQFTMAVDCVILAIGYDPEAAIPQWASGLELTKDGRLVADRSTGRTSRPGVWAGGDVVTGAATVVEAMAAGRRAAADIHAWLQGD